jgi:RimJ/RimL family protein N-acetyltransferase
MNHLEELQETDFETVARWMSDPVEHERICGNAFSYPLSFEQYCAFFINAARNRDKRLCFKFISSGEPVGMASFTRISRENDYGHIGIVAIDPSKRNLGYGLTMVRALLSFGFNDMQFNRIDLVVIESNIEAYTFYTDKVGFKNEGLIRDIIRVGMRYVSWHSLSMLKSEWEILKR